jgi:hypothetical protein
LSKGISLPKQTSFMKTSIVILGKQSIEELAFKPMDFLLNERKKQPLPHPLLQQFEN